MISNQACWSTALHPMAGELMAAAPSKAGIAASQGDLGKEVNQSVMPAKAGIQ
jgi:hypothetical protein